MKHKTLIHQALKIIQSDVAAGFYPAYGICHAMESYYGGWAGDEIAGELMTLMTKWPKFSGSDAYPVPAPSHYNPPARSPFVPLALAYFWGCSGAARWDANAEYGASRRELLAWLIEQTKE